MGALTYRIQQRGALAVGQSIRTTKKYRRMYRKSKATTGKILALQLGTMVSVKFDAYRWPNQIDERYLEAVPTAT